MLLKCLILLLQTAPLTSAFCKKKLKLLDPPWPEVILIHPDSPKILQYP